MRETEQEHEIRPIVWIRSSHEDLKRFPPEVQKEINLIKRRLKIAQTLGKGK